MRKNADQNNSKYGHFSHSANVGYWNISSSEYGEFLGNIEEKRVSNQLVQKIEKIHLTDQQKKKFLQSNWFLKPSILPCNLPYQFEGQKYFSWEKQIFLWTTNLKTWLMEHFFEVGAVYFLKESDIGQAN